MNAILIQVAAAVIERNGRYLVCKRPAHKRHGGLWEFPGGKHELGEGASEALTRELQEELGLAVSALGRALLQIHDPGSPFVITFHQTTVQGTPVPTEHEEIRWASVTELRELPLAPSDRLFVEQRLLA